MNNSTLNSALSACTATWTDYTLKLAHQADVRGQILLAGTRLMVTGGISSAKDFIYHTVKAVSTLALTVLARPSNAALSFFSGGKLRFNIEHYNLKEAGKYSCKALGYLINTVMTVVIGLLFPKAQMRWLINTGLGKLDEQYFHTLFPSKALLYLYRYNQLPSEKKQELSRLALAAALSNSQRSSLNARTEPQAPSQHSVITTAAAVQNAVNSTISIGSNGSLNTPLPTVHHQLPSPKLIVGKASAPMLPKKSKAAQKKEQVERVERLFKWLRDKILAAGPEKRVRAPVLIWNPRHVAVQDDAGNPVLFQSYHGRMMAMMLTKKIALQPGKRAFPKIKKWKPLDHSVSGKVLKTKSVSSAIGPQTPGQPLSPTPAPETFLGRMIKRIQDKNIVVEPNKRPYPPISKWNARHVKVDALRNVANVDGSSNLPSQQMLSQQQQKSIALSSSSGSGNNAQPALPSQTVKRIGVPSHSKTLTLTLSRKKSAMKTRHVAFATFPAHHGAKQVSIQQAFRRLVAEMSSSANTSANTSTASIPQGQNYFLMPSTANANKASNAGQDSLTIAFSYDQYQHLQKFFSSMMKGGQNSLIPQTFVSDSEPLSLDMDKKYKSEVVILQISGIALQQLKKMMSAMILSEKSKNSRDGLFIDNVRGRLLGRGHTVQQISLKNQPSLPVPKRANSLQIVSLGLPSATFIPHTRNISPRSLIPKRSSSLTVGSSSLVNPMARTIDLNNNQHPKPLMTALNSSNLLAQYLLSIHEPSPSSDLALMPRGSSQHSQGHLTQLLPNDEIEKLGHVEMQSKLLSPISAELLGLNYDIEAPFTPLLYFASLIPSPSVQPKRQGAAHDTPGVLAVQPLTGPRIHPQAIGHHSFHFPIMFGSLAAEPFGQYVADDVPQDPLPAVPHDSQASHPQIALDHENEHIAPQDGEEVLQQLHGQNLADVAHGNAQQQAELPLAIQPAQPGQPEQPAVQPHQPVEPQQPQQQPVGLQQPQQVRTQASVSHGQGGDEARRHAEADQKLKLAAQQEEREEESIWARANRPQPVNKILQNQRRFARL